MALCIKHGQVYGEGCVCSVCAKETKGASGRPSPSAKKSANNAVVIPQKA